MQDHGTGKRPDAYLQYRFVRLADQFQRRFRAALEPAGVTPRQFSVLAVLAVTPDITAAELARAVLLTPQSMGPLMDQLEARELVERRDRRGRGYAAPARVTAKGFDVLRQANRVVDELDRTTRQLLGPEDHQTLLRILAALENDLDDAQRSTAAAPEHPTA